MPHTDSDPIEPSREYIPHEQVSDPTSIKKTNGCLNADQQRALNEVLEGHSVFITGPGGTGKSHLIKTIHDVLQDQHKRVAITALTGCAALLLGFHAKTIHSWGGIGLGREDPKKVANEIKRLPYKNKVYRRWLLTSTLIIDEVSMMTPELFEYLNTVGQILRKSSKPFGGIQLVLVGDFFQLPPVYKKDEGEEKVMRFLFESDLWKSMRIPTIVLREIMRQKDPVFQQILDEARFGSLTEKSLQILLNRQKEDWSNLKIKPTLLFSRRAEVEMINEQNIKALSGKSYIFEAKTVFDATLIKGLTENSPEVVRAVSKLDRDASYKPHLVLKVGMQVMLIYNMDQESGLVNGSRGVVEGFTETVPPFPVVYFKSSNSSVTISPHSWESEDIEGLHRQQIPLLPAYAITIHRCQGSTLDSALIDIGPSTFEVGQAYVALSRVKNLESLYIYDLDPKAFKAHPKVVEFYKAL
jgi:ATP-dependent DNA helicase PIF1